jgi:hypothetical protein
MLQQEIKYSSRYSILNAICNDQKKMYIFFTYFIQETKNVCSYADALIKER